MHRFFVEPGVTADEQVTLEGSLAHQIARVLRLRPGEQITLLDGSGRECVVQLVEVTPRRVCGIVRQTRVSGGEPRLTLTLYQALVPRDKLEVAIQKGTEAGVSTFVPVSCARSVVPRGDVIDERRLERWRRIAREAAEQSRRGRIPHVGGPLPFADALSDAVSRGPVIVAWEAERRRSIRAALTHVLHHGPASGLSVFVGPEGGFSEAEMDQASARGALSASLGPRILRTETVGPIVAALALYEAGELEPSLDGSAPPGS